MYSRSAGSVGECPPQPVLSQSQTTRFIGTGGNINLVQAPAVVLLKQMVSDKQEPLGHSSLFVSISKVL